MLISVWQDRSVVHMGDADMELLFNNKDKMDLMSAEAWKHMGAKPFKDDYMQDQEKGEV